MSNICNTNHPLVDIRMNNVQGKCDYKCELVLTYKTINEMSIEPSRDGKPYTTLGVGEQGVYTDGSPSIVYDKEKFCNIDARIYTPSMHNYQGEPVAGELILKHNACDGSNRLLYICIPLISGNGGSTLDNLLNRWSKLNKSPNVPFNASFGSFIPKKTYYNYTSKPIWSDLEGKYCNETAKYVVFDINDALSLSNTSLQLINQVSNPDAGTLDAKSDVPAIFLSTNAPGETGLEDIYIDCQPVGASGKTIQEQNMPALSTDIDKPNLFIAEKFIPVIVGAILMYFAYKLISYLLCRLSIGTFTSGKKVVGGPDACDITMFGINVASTK